MQLGWILVPAASLPHRPFEEDTFFHLTACRNLAEGKGLTIDGRPTSGAQFGTLIFTLAYLALPGAEDALHLRLARAISFLGSVYSTFAVAFLAWAFFRRHTNSAITLAGLSAALWFSSFQVFRINMNGYETVFATGTLLFSVGLFCLRWDAKPKAGLPLDILMGISLGLCVLARIDLGLWAMVAAFSYLIFRNAQFLSKLLTIGIWAFLAFAISLPLWIHNFAVGGSFMPISGKASAFQMTFHGYPESVFQCLIRILTALGEIPLLSFYGPYSWGDQWQGFVVAGVGLTLLLGSLYVVSRQDHGLAPSSKASLAAISLFCLLVICYYTFAHGSWWFTKRYLHPLRGIFFAFSGYYLIVLSKAVYPLLNVRLRAWGVAPFVAAILAISVAQYVLTYGDTRSNTFVPTAKWVNENLPNSSRKAAFQSGTLGYFCANVTNLDGKNNPEALRAILRGDLMGYIRNQDFDYVIDWPSQVAKYVPMQSFLELYQPFHGVGPGMVYKKINSR